MTLVRWLRLRDSPVRMALGTLAAGLLIGAVAGALALTSSASSTSFPAVAGPPGTPPARMDAAIGYDPDTKQVVMFGGQGDSGSLADTWIWSGGVWRQERSSISPAARSDAGMVFDSALRALCSSVARLRHQPAISAPHGSGPVTHGSDGRPPRPRQPAWHKTILATTP